MSLDLTRTDADYRALNADYIRRQVLRYALWPQYHLGPMGYEDRKVFLDQNT